MAFLSSGLGPECETLGSGWVFSWMSLMEVILRVRFSELIGGDCFEN